MTKRFLIPILLLAFLLAACDGETQTPEQGAAVQEENPAPVADAEVETSNDDSADEPAPPAEFVSECTIVSSMAESSSQYEELFSVTDNDWVIGPEHAAITIVEYGDYQ